MSLFSRASRRVRSSQIVCRFGVPVEKSGRSREVLAVDLQVAGVEAVVGDGAVRDHRAGGGGLVGRVRRCVEVGRAAVLVDHVVRVKGDELHRADLEGVEVAAQAVAVPVGDPVVRQEEAAQVMAVAVGAVPVVAGGGLCSDAAWCLAWPSCVVAGAELGLVVAEGRHPGAVGRGPGDVDAEVAPDTGGVQEVKVRVAEVAVEQVEERRALAVAGALDGVHGVERVVAGLVPLVAGGVQVEGRGREVTVGGEAELGASCRCCLEARSGCGCCRRAPSLTW